MMKRRGKKKAQMEFPDHCIPLYFCFNFVSEFNVCRKQLMSLKGKEKNVNAPNHDLITGKLGSLTFRNLQVGSSPCSLQTCQHFRGKQFWTLQARTGTLGLVLFISLLGMGEWAKDGTNYLGVVNRNAVSSGCKALEFLISPLRGYASCKCTFCTAHSILTFNF